jgi:hypothetical protein
MPATTTKEATKDFTDVEATRTTTSNITTDKAMPAAAGIAANEETWHARFGHASCGMIGRLMNSVEGLHITGKACQDSHCEICYKTKLPKAPFPISTTRATKPLALVHMDISGPSRTPCIGGGETWSICFVDDCSRFKVIYLMRYKSDALEKLKEYKAVAEAHSGYKLKALRGDNDGVFTSVAFRAYCRDNSIHQEYTVPYNPQQNGVAERSWRSIFNMVRAMIAEAALPYSFWGRAALTAAFVQNRILHAANRDNKTPFELFYGRKPNVSNLRIFGSKVYYHNERPSIDKLADRGLTGIFC